MNSGGAPGGILLDHTPNENSNLGIDLWPAQPACPRSKAPEQSKPGSMLGHNGLWFDDDQDIAPSGPKPAEQYPKQPILDAQLRARILSLEYAELLAQGQDLKAEAVAGTKEGAQEGEEYKRKWHRGLGFIAYESTPVPALIH